MSTRSLTDLRVGGRPLLLLFVDPGCGPCSALLPDVGRWQRELAAETTIAVISRGTIEANRAKAGEHGVASLLLQRDYEVADAYAIFGTPSAVLVRPDGTIGSPAAGGVEQIRSLVAHPASTDGGQPWRPQHLLPVLDHGAEQHGNSDLEADHSVSAPTIAVGEPVPPLVLPDLDGALVDLASPGRSTLVLFWNPECGFCQELLPELLAWEADPPPKAPDLLVVSVSTFESNRALGLRAPIVLDRELEAGWTFGIQGTPSAMLVDADGRVASELAVGAPAIRALAGVGRDQARLTSV